jgi:hypothetical protein
MVSLPLESHKHTLVLLAGEAVVDILANDVYLIELFGIAIMRLRPIQFERKLSSVLKTYFSGLQSDLQAWNEMDLDWLLERNSCFLFLGHGDGAFQVGAALCITQSRTDRLHIIRYVCDRVIRETTRTIEAKNHIRLAKLVDTILVDGPDESLPILVQSLADEIIRFFTGGDAFWKLREDFRSLLFPKDCIPNIEGIRNIARPNASKAGEYGDLTGESRRHK